MRTEARRKYSCGFVLTEQELRRIHDVADQQMKRALPATPYLTEYELKFRNGAIAEPKSLDEVFEAENWGSTAVTRVSISFREQQDQPKTRISVKFSDITEAQDSETIGYSLEGDDRDWVFVASSQLSERITRVDRFNAQKALASPITPLLAAIVFLVAMLSFSNRETDKALHSESAVVRQLQQERDAGVRLDPVDVILRVDESFDGIHVGAGEYIKGLGIPAVAIILIILAAKPMVNYVYPSYNFVWGEYQNEFEKRRGRTRFILVGVLLTVALGILVNLLSKKLGW